MEVRTSTNTSERLRKLEMLKGKLQESAAANRREVIQEHKRRSVNVKETTKLERKRDEAEFMLQKQELEDAGQDFERKRAWDWTIEESQEWDKTRAKKQRRKEESTSSDFTREAQKGYKKLIHNLERELKSEQVGLAAEEDKPNSLHSNSLILNDSDAGQRSNPLDFVANKPSKESIDRLVSHLNNKESARLKKDQRSKSAAADVTYINERNESFNRKLSRHLDEYTQDIKDSLERGSAI